MLFISYLSYNFYFLCFCIYFIYSFCFNQILLYYMYFISCTVVYYVFYNVLITCMPVGDWHLLQVRANVVCLHCPTLNKVFLLLLLLLLPWTLLSGMVVSASWRAEVRRFNCYLVRRPCTSRKRVQGRSQGTTLCASHLHSARETIFNTF